MIRITLLVLLSLSSLRTAADVDFSSLAWLEGCWSGDGLGGQIEECWISAPDGRLTGVFQLVIDGKQQFSEILMLTSFSGQIGLRVKHFDADFEQWPSDQGVGHTFPFIETGDGYIRFAGLSYERQGDELLVTLQLEDADGTVRSQVLRLTPS